MDKFLGIDIGAEKTHIGIGNQNGLESDAHVIDTASYWSEKELVELARKKIDELGYSEEDINSIGIGASAVVDKKQKEVEQPVLLDKISFQPVEEELGIPVHVDADCNTAVIAEKMFGDGKEKKNLVTLTMSGGVGAGVYFDNQLLSFSRRMPVAGHIMLDYKEGKVWEDIFSGIKYNNFLIQKIKGSTKTALNTSIRDKDITLEHVKKKAEEGDKIAQEYLEDVAYINSVGIANIANAYSPELITFRGYMAENNPEIMKESFEQVKYHTVTPTPEMKLTEVENIGIKGAIGLAIKENKK